MFRDLIFSQKLSPNEKVLLLVLIMWEEDVRKGKIMDIHPGQKLLAEQCNMGIKSVRRAIDGLKKKKLVNTKLKANRSSLLYTLSTAVVKSIWPNVGSKGHNGLGQKGVVDNIINNNIINSRSKGHNLLVFDELEYPVAISGLNFDSPWQIGQYVKENKSLHKQLTDALRVCGCGQKVIGSDKCSKCKSEPVKKSGEGPSWSPMPDYVKEAIENIG
jgi:hypothetical protein